MKNQKEVVKPEMRKLADLIKSWVEQGYPAYPGMNILQWCELFGDGQINWRMLYDWAAQKRIPSIEMLILFGVLLQKSEISMEVGVYDPLLAAADGIYRKFAEELELEGELSPLEEYLNVFDPEEAQLAPPASADIYRRMPYADRKKIMPGLLTAIERDIRFFQMTSDFQVAAELTKEAAYLSFSNSPKKLALAADVPESLVRRIIEGDLERSKAIATTSMIFKLASKVKDLDGRVGSPELFACLLSPQGQSTLEEEYRQWKIKDFDPKSKKACA